MGMCLALHSVSDTNIDRIITSPSLIWRLLAPDDPEIYTEAVAAKNKTGFLIRLFGKKQSPTAIESPNLEFVEGENRDDDLDKSWQGIHYCLNQTDYEAEPPMDFITVGGELAGDIDVGYGPARLLRSDTVKVIEQKLSQLSRHQLYQNYDPAAMDKLDIYPNIWLRDGDEGFEYIAEYFQSLKDFVEHCSQHNLGMAIYLC